MQDDEKSNAAIPSGIAAVFRSQERIDFVNQADGRRIDHRPAGTEKFHKSRLVLKKHSGTISGRGDCAFTFH
jgi:hypothetical protein